MIQGTSTTDNFRIIPARFSKSPINDAETNSSSLLCVATPEPNNPKRKEGTDEAWARQTPAKLILEKWALISASSSANWRRRRREQQRQRPSVDKSSKKSSVRSHTYKRVCVNTLVTPIMKDAEHPAEIPQAFRCCR